MIIGYEHQQKYYVKPDVVKLMVHLGKKVEFTCFQWYFAELVSWHCIVNSAWQFALNLVSAAMAVQQPAVEQAKLKDLSISGFFPQYYVVVIWFKG